jgi:LacI family transcriptional regulator
MLRDRGVDGLIISTTLANNADIEELQKENFPFVLVDRFIPGADMPFVTADNYAGSVEVVEHLINLGMKRIGQLTISPAHLTSITERTRGYRDALEKNGIGFDPKLVREISYDNIRGDMFKILPELVNPPHSIQALYVLNNNLAMAALDCLNEMGKRIPEDIAVVSFDDVDLFRFVTPPITAVAQPVVEMGKESVNILLEMIDGKGEFDLKSGQRFLATELIVRQSCGSHLVKK